MKNVNPSHASILDPATLGQQIAAKRHNDGLTLRQLSEKTGVSVPTLSRVERGGHLPDRENLLRLAQWLGVAFGPLDLRAVRNRAVHRADAGTVEAVELHLRADRNLKGEDARALAELFRIAYERLRVPSKEEDSR